MARGCERFLSMSIGEANVSVTLFAALPDKLLGADDTPANKQDVTLASLSHSFDSV